MEERKRHRKKGIKIDEEINSNESKKKKMINSLKKTVEGKTLLMSFNLF